MKLTLLDKRGSLSAMGFTIPNRQLRNRYITVEFDDLRKLNAKSSELVAKQIYEWGDKRCDNRNNPAHWHGGFKSCRKRECGECWQELLEASK